MKQKGKAKLSYLLQIIELCRMVEQRGLDPFEVDVKEILERLRESLSQWKLPQEYLLDVKALNEITEIIKLQGEWVKHRSSSLYVDSLLVALKIQTLDVKALAQIFIKAWHPTASVEKFSPERVREAVEYWNRLLPMGERIWGLPVRNIPSELINRDDLFRLQLLSEEAFEQVLESHWKALLNETEGKEELPYWNFIYSEDYESTVFKAYLTSFLVTYGYATLRVDPIQNEIFIRPFPQPVSLSVGEKVFTIPISINYETWRKFKEAKSEGVH